VLGRFSKQMQDIIVVKQEQAEGFRFHELTPTQTSMMLIIEHINEGRQGYIEAVKTLLLNTFKQAKVTGNAQEMPNHPRLGLG
jgi:hypothetical protein